MSTVLQVIPIHNYAHVFFPLSSPTQRSSHNWNVNYHNYVHITRPALLRPLWIRRRL